ncbi:MULTISPECIES: DegT/DnrJ/EryC1/StrS family aminotransferase [Kitasatospora]|uniref:Putative aminotransferase n=1 Tax=Kitasatospora setae (strain ATCC 33774 / DSM 43861 / JCM 3304 / KCC A-0304 / NBRC 14216 / KM-6054) TaxID=452652 RepID=E4NDK5_KITSK|nr:DegT/DnrJ/EryC1/StrS family aminotransferase [Kitasatospora setae]BAJ29286.1 putative aminotransferase [Kitasatospora setae KM-6054]
MNDTAVTLPFPREPKYGQAEKDAVLKLLDDGHLSEINRGPATNALEAAFARLTGTRHALSFNSGTASLHAALHAVGASPEAGVAVSPMTWVSALTAVFQAGSYPVFCDIEPDSPNIAAATITQAVGACSAVLATHTWGVPARMDQLAAATGLPIVEDCSHAHGALYQGRPVGSWGAAGCFSLQESKAVSGGEGGILTTTDRQVYERALTLGHHPARLAAELTLPDLLPFATTGAAYKYRMPALSAVIARQQLRSLPDRMLAAEQNLATLRKALEEYDVPLAWPEIGELSVRGWYGTPLTINVRVPDPVELSKRFKAAGVPVGSLYEDWTQAPLLQHPDLAARFWPHLAHSPYRPPTREELPNFHKAMRQMIVLKVPQILAPDYMEQVAEALAAVLVRTLVTA